MRPGPSPYARAQFRRIRGAIFGRSLASKSGTALARASGIVEGTDDPLTTRHTMLVFEGSHDEGQRSPCCRLPGFLATEPG